MKKIYVTASDHNFGTFNKKLYTKGHMKALVEAKRMERDFPSASQYNVLAFDSGKKIWLKEALNILNMPEIQKFSKEEKDKIFNVVLRCLKMHSLEVYVDVQDFFEEDGKTRLCLFSAVKMIINFTKKQK